MFPASFDKEGEDDQVLNEIEIYTNLNFNKILTESDFDKIEIRSQIQR